MATAEYEGGDAGGYAAEQYETTDQIAAGEGGAMASEQYGVMGDADNPAPVTNEELGGDAGYDDGQNMYTAAAGAADAAALAGEAAPPAEGGISFTPKRSDRPLAAPSPEPPATPGGRSPPPQGRGKGGNPLEHRRGGRHGENAERENRVPDGMEWKCSHWIAAIAEEIAFSIFFRCYVGYYILSSLIFSVCWGYHVMMATAYRQYVPPEGEPFWVSLSMLCAFVLVMTLATAVIDMHTRLFINWLGFSRDSANLFWLPNGIGEDSHDASEQEVIRLEAKCIRRRNYMLLLFEIVILVVPFLYGIISPASKGESMLAFLGAFSFCGFVIFEILMFLLYIMMWYWSLKAKTRAWKEGGRQKKAFLEQKNKAGAEREARQDASPRTVATGRDDPENEAPEHWKSGRIKNPLVMSEFGFDIFSVRVHTLTIFMGLPWMVVMLMPQSVKIDNIAWLMIVAAVLVGAIFTAASIAKSSQDPHKTSQNQHKTSWIAAIAFAVFGLAGILGAGVGGANEMAVVVILVLLLLTQGLMYRRHDLHVETPFQKRKMSLKKDHREMQYGEDSSMTKCVPLLPCPNIWGTCCKNACIDKEDDEDYIYSHCQMDCSGKGEPRVTSTTSRTIVQPPRVPGFDNSYTRIRVFPYDNTTLRRANRAYWDEMLAQIATEEGEGLKPGQLKKRTGGVARGAKLIDADGQSLTTREDADRLLKPGTVSQGPVYLTFKHPLLIPHDTKARLTREAHLDQQDRVLNANLLINIWYFIFFIALSGIAFGYSVAEPLKGKVAQVVSPIPPANDAYPMCQMRWDTMDFTVTDFAYLAMLSYHDSLQNFNKDLDIWFANESLQVLWPPEEVELSRYAEMLAKIDAVMASKDTNPVEWFDVYSEAWHQHVILIKGDVGGKGWMRDIDIWGDAVLFQVLTTLVPFWALWPEDVVAPFVSFLGFVKQGLAPGDHLADIEAYIRKGVKLGNGTYTITGHGNAGGWAKLLGQKLGLPVVAFAPPGTRWTSERLGIPAPLEVDDVSIVPERAMLPMVDRLNGFVQEVNCNEDLSMTACQLMENIVCEMVKKCGDSRGRTMTIFPDPSTAKCKYEPKL